MANSYIQVALDSTGKKVDAGELTVGANTVERQRIVLASDSVAAGLADVNSIDPVGTEYGLVTRIAPLQAASSYTHTNVSLGSSTGKIVINSTSSLTTTSNSSNQVVVTRTVTTGKTLYLQAVMISVRLSTFATTVTNFGQVSIQINGSAIVTVDATGAGGSGILTIPFTEPLPVGSGVVARVVCTPSGSTSYAWKAALIGYEK